MNLTVFMLFCFVWLLLSIVVLIYGTRRRMDYEWIVIICGLLNPFFGIMAAGAAGMINGFLWVSIVCVFIGPLTSYLIAAAQPRANDSMIW